MPSLKVKQDKNTELTGFPLPHIQNNEIDLLNLIAILWQVKKRIIACALAFAFMGLFVTFFLPQRWTSEAMVTPAESIQWQDLRRTLTGLRVLDLDVSVDSNNIFNLFIKKFQSSSLLEQYLRSSPYVMEQLKGAEINELDLHRAVVALSEKMKAVDSNAGKKNETALYTSWALSFTAPTKEEAQQVLAGYIQFISDIVVQDSLENIRNQLEVKTRFEKERLALDRVKLKNQLETNIQRLNYSLEIANAAGIKKPVYSNGQAVKDDPDFSISLGADGIQRKLEIEKSVTDVAELNAELKNRQYYVEQLESVDIHDVKFSPFKYQLEPSLPVRKQGPGKMIVVVLAAIMGGIVACAGVLLHHAMAAHKRNGATVSERLV
ncbi:LPS O-antigen length regulator Wzz(fepE) [Citrobacter farmeri]|uniref:O-antigen length regulator n=1 Tax=Citrobacter amalonaticus Y19 TaxID=1261127 RepID=A0A0F6TTU2_CITAM|nr:LPS O-antigen length regulator Wzz(fepE) [Citrobacter amalonaticus]AKE58111.1 O-antigen length regulator [Citrobacter amalonaticus Y19]EKV5656467.1 LPS O-antigen length regulator [Citrobacter farmeri]